MRELPRVREHLDLGETINVFFVGDLHLGAPDTRYDLIARDLKKVEEDPNARIVFMGDFGEFIDFRDHRFKPDVAHLLPSRYRDAHLSKDGGIIQETIDHCQELFEPVKRKVWAWLDGNHEEKVVLRHSFSPGSVVCSNLDILTRYVGYGGYFAVQLVRNDKKSVGYSFKMDLHHGWQAGRRDGAAINQGQLELSTSDSDVVARGHSHKRGVWHFDSWRFGQRNMIEWQRYFLATGTYKQGHSNTTANSSPAMTYELKRGFVPKTTIGMGGVWLSITMSDGKNRPTVYLKAEL